MRKGSPISRVTFLRLVVKQAQVVSHPDPTRGWGLGTRLKLKMQASHAICACGARGQFNDTAPRVHMDIAKQRYCTGQVYSNGGVFSEASGCSSGLPLAHGMHVHVCLCLTLYSATRCVSAIPCRHLHVVEEAIFTTTLLRKHPIMKGYGVMYIGYPTLRVYRVRFRFLSIVRDDT